MYTYSAVVDIHCNTSLAKISSRDIDFMESIFEVIFKSWSGSGRLAGLGELNLDYGKRGGLSQHSFRWHKSVTQTYMLLQNGLCVLFSNALKIQTCHMSNHFHKHRNLPGKRVQITAYQIPDMENLVNLANLVILMNLVILANLEILANLVICQDHKIR